MNLPFACGAALSRTALGLLVLAVSCSSPPEAEPAAVVSAPPPTAPDATPAPSLPARAARRRMADGLLPGMKRYRPRGEKQPAFATCAGPHLSYFGGPILQSPVIVPVFWNGNVNPVTQANKPQFYADVTRSSYWAWLREYDTVGLTPGTSQAILAGTATAGVVLTPQVCPASMTGKCALTDDDLQAELTRQIGLGTLPAPTLDCTGNVQTIYMVDLPSNITLTGPDGTGISCKQFCAYHSTGTYGPNGTPLIYAALMDYFAGPCANGCGDNAATLDNETETASHELAEAVTDTDIGLDTMNGYASPAGWGDNDNQCGEIGDICDSMGSSVPITVSGRTWQVQQLWSNQQGKCASSGPAVTICSGTSVTGCLQCSCGDSGGACGGATPVCETDPTNVLFGACEQCTAKSGTCATCQQSSTPGQDDVCVGCSPITACPAGEDCGTVPNGCGGTFSCGTCGSPLTCGGGSPSQTNVCGCPPSTTACPAGSTCGSVPDGCGNMIACGTCTAPQTCGGGTPSNPLACGCTPVTYCAASANCGTNPDKCGGTVTCGPACTAPETCGGNPQSTPNVCGCTPLAACPASAVCGDLSDGCGGMLMCGFCAGTEVCSASNECVAGTTSSSGAGSGGSGPSSSSTGTGGGGTTTGAAEGKSGCSCKTAGDPAAPAGMSLSALGMLALAAATRSRRARRSR